MHVVIGFIIGIALLSGFQPIKKIPADEFVMSVASDMPVKVRQYVRPLTEIQNDRLIKQSYDYSCGSSALAALLKFQFGEDLTEKQVIHGLLRYGDVEKIQARRAFSLLDMKKFVTKLGYKGIGYKANIDDLTTLKQPGIIPIKLFGYRHFTVLKGIFKNHIFLVDPWRGHSSYTLDEFKQMWFNNVVFIVYPEKGQKQFHALQLKEEDLRFIEEDAIREVITRVNYSFSKSLSIPITDFIKEIPGEFQVYKN